MTKKMIIALAALSVMATPVAARERHERERPRHEERKQESVKPHRHGGGGILGFIAGVLVGTAVSESYPRYYYQPQPYGMPPYEPYRPNVYPYNQYYCATEQHVDYYGNIYYTRRCNY